MRSLLTWIAAAVTAGILTTGCAETCDDNRNALPLAGFYVIDSIGAPVQVSVDSLTVVGVGMQGDSVLSGPASKQELYLPFKIDADVTQYVFVDSREGSPWRDTVTFDYTRVPHFVSAECGVSYIFHIHSITSQGLLIDSVVCPQGFIDNVSSQNLRIYLRTQ